jgi:[pyruvate, water dikinase]-phosphate phosphotransferase / [pyruvate, water dikinase] kinase
MRRTVFFVSDSTGITAETLGNSLLTQFDGLDFKRITLPFVDNQETARAALSRIETAAVQDGARPLVFATMADPDLLDFLTDGRALVLDLFRVFIGRLEAELGRTSSHAKGRFHGMADNSTYDVRMDTLNFALTHDDGMSTARYPQADLVLLGVSRAGKTPTCIYLAMQFGVRAANYPLTEENLTRQSLPKVLVPIRRRLYGLTIDPERLHRIRSERRRHSAYASLNQCRKEITDAEALFRSERIRSLNVTSMSIEEIGSHLLQEMGLERRSF